MRFHAQVFWCLSTQTYVAFLALVMLDFIMSAKVIIIDKLQISSGLLLIFYITSIPQARLHRHCSSCC